MKAIVRQAVESRKYDVQLMTDKEKLWNACWHTKQLRLGVARISPLLTHRHMPTVRKSLRCLIQQAQINRAEAKMFAAELPPVIV